MQSLDKELSNETCFLSPLTFDREQGYRKVCLDKVANISLKNKGINLKSQKKVYTRIDHQVIVRQFSSRVDMTLSDSLVSTVVTMPQSILSREIIFESKDLTIAFLDLLGATVWILFWQWISSKEWIERTVSRKIVHMTCTPLFVLTWPLFTDLSGSRWVASIVPLLMGIRLWVAGKGWSRDTISKIVSRKGSVEEALKGPLYYVIVTFLVTLFCWKDSPLGVVALMQLCLGDGFAEVVGRRWGKSLVWPFCKDKSVVGTLAFSVAGWVASYGALIYFKNMGIFFQGNELSTLSLVLVTFACSAVELVPFLDDNFSVPLVAILVGALFLKPNSI